MLVWLWFEYGRPANPLGVPLIISSVLLVGWLLAKDKRWSGQSVLLVSFLGLMAIEVPLAPNNFSAFWSLYSMATLLLSICIPLPWLVTSVRKARVWIYTFVLVCVYVASWAVLHGGYGPAGAGGAQDENYVAAMMAMAIAFAYFSSFAAKRRLTKILLAGSIPLFLGATLAGQNASRGGFLGLCAVFLYCLARSPRKWIGIVVIAVILAVVLPFAGPDYWDDIASISDVHEGTADMRLEIWQIGIRMWQDHPIFGVGPGNFIWMTGAYQSSEQTEKYGRGLGGSIVAHSLFIELLAELGSAGALLLLLLLGRTARDLWRVIRDSRSRPGAPAPDEARALRCYADGAAGAIIACLVNGAFVSLLYFSYLWLFIMLANAISQISRAHSDVSRAPLAS